MEKITSICTMREIVLGLTELEQTLLECSGLTLNEAMTVCCLAHEEVASTEVAARLGLRPAHTSKVLTALEGRGLLLRRIGESDRRRMYFSLSAEGQRCLEQLRHIDLTIPAVLRPLFTER